MSPCGLGILDPRERIERGYTGHRAAQRRQTNRPDGSLVVAPVGARGGAASAELAYQALRDAILAMDIYRPDADLRLDEQRLAAALGVSRTPVREALARLEHEGLVRILPRRGV